MTADLYELTDDDAGWRMPIRVRWVNEALAEVKLAEIPLLRIQEQAISKKLGDASTHVTHGIDNSGVHTFWIPILSLNAIAKKSDETDPERLVRWQMPEPDIEADADFALALSNQHGVLEIFKNPQAAEVILGQINRFMLKWLVAEGRPINFGWGRMESFPLRVNWKNAIIGRIFKPGHLKQKELYTQENYDFFRGCISCHTETELLTAYDATSNTMRWSVEFTPSQTFHDATIVAENKRKENQHPQSKSNYLQQVLQSLRKPGILNRLHETLIAYAKETNLPYAILPDGSSSRHPPKGYQPTRGTVAWHTVNLVTAAAAKGHSGCTLVPEDAGVPSVSDLRPLTEDVRFAGDSMDAAGND